jgi:hypothetical protein
MKTSKNSNGNSNGNGKAAAAKAAAPKGKAPAKKAAPAKKGKATAKVTKRTAAKGMFDMSACAIARALGKLGWASADALKALAKTGLPERTIRGLVSRGKLGKGSAPAQLNRVQIAQLRKLAA